VGGEGLIIAVGWPGQWAANFSRDKLESIRRAVRLHKSDMNYGDLEAKHTQFYGLSLWHPYFATGTGRVDPYSDRTAFAPMLALGYDALFLEV